MATARDIIERVSSGELDRDEAADLMAMNGIDPCDLAGEIAEAAGKPQLNLWD